MKKFLIWFLAMIGVVVVSVVSSLAYNHYVTQESPDAVTEDTMDLDIQVNNAVMQVIDPSFMSVEEVQRFRTEMVNTDSIDKVFVSIPTETLIDVAKVVIGNYGWATKKAIVEEYQEHGSIYKHLTHEPSNPPSDTISEGTPDTVINGVSYKKVHKPIK